MRDSTRGSASLYTEAEDALNDEELELLGVDESRGRFAAEGLSRVRCHVREPGGDAEGVISGGLNGGGRPTRRSSMADLLGERCSHRWTVVVDVEYRNGNVVFVIVAHVILKHATRRVSGTSASSLSRYTNGPQMQR